MMRKSTVLTTISAVQHVKQVKNKETPAGLPKFIHTSTTSKVLHLHTYRKDWHVQKGHSYHIWQEHLHIWNVTQQDNEFCSEEFSVSAQGSVSRKINTPISG